MSGDDDDPDLLNELSEITGVENEEEVTTPQETSPPILPTTDAASETIDQPILPTTTLSTVELLKSRLELYRLAEKLAKESGDSTRARSRGRGAKTLETMLKQALAGKTINPDDIPPVVSIKTANEPPPSQPSEAPQSTPMEVQPDSQPDPQPQPQVVSSDPVIPAVDETKINALVERRGEYKTAAITAKRSGDNATALQYVKMIKIFDTVLASARNGEAIDLSDMPPPPSELSSDMLKAVGQAQDPVSPPKQENTIQQSSDENTNPVQPAEPIPKPVELPPPEVPKTILEALTQRLQKYQSVEANAKAEGNDRKARQNGRIVKQYQDAIKAHKAGRPVVFDELPTPPGYGPIPGNDQPKPAPAPRPAPAIPSGSDDPEPGNTSPKKSPIKRQDSRISGNHSNTSVMNKTIELLLLRQKEFKEAAINAKKAGELEQAKEFLKTFKGIESLLNVARGGLPVDLSTVRISKTSNLHHFHFKTNILATYFTKTTN